MQERKKCVSVEKKYSAGSHVFDQMTLIFLYKPINYGVACSLYGVACSDTMPLRIGLMRSWHIHSVGYPTTNAFCIYVGYVFAWVICLIFCKLFIVLEESYVLDSKHNGLLFVIPKPGVCRYGRFQDIIVIHEISWYSSVLVLYG